MSWNKRDQSAIWHLNTRQQIVLTNINIVKAEGAYLWDEQGKKYIDATASNGVCLHGHRHPHIQHKVNQQLEAYDQIHFNGWTHPIAIELAENILSILPQNQSKIIFSENSTHAIHIALKICLQYWKQLGEDKKHFIAFEGCFHTETVQDLRDTKIDTPFHLHFVPLPNENNLSDIFDQITQLNDQFGIAGFILEPLIQSRAGMRIYAAEDLEKLILHCQKINILCIADERWTAFGKTGAMLACDHMEIVPDIFCLSDGLTAGFSPMGVTSCTSDIYHAYLSKQNQIQLNFESTYEANPIACAAALASLEIFKQENYIDEIVRIVYKHLAIYEYLKDNPHFKNVRQLGTILAFDLDVAESSSHFTALKQSMNQAFIQQGIIIHLIGKTIFISPPFCATNEDLDHIYSSIFKVIKAFL